MKISVLSTLVFALAAETVVASSWFSKAVYNKWHETELERWLSDHNVPYPTPADRKDLENLIKNNWNAKVVTPYNEWETPQLQSYLKSKGADTQKSASSNKDSLVAEVKKQWTDTSDTVSDSYGNTRNWIFDSWTDSQLKAFCDKNGIPVPQPRKRDSLLSTARNNYQSVAKKLDEASQYPGNWLYESWTQSELKEFLDERGIPVPQPTTRDKLIASVRRNARIASVNTKAAASSASASAAAAQESLTDALLDAWSDARIKQWADEKGIKVPQGSKRNELLAIARRNRALLLEKQDSASSSASSVIGAATTKAGNEYAKASDDAQLKAESTFDSAVAFWSDSRLKAYLDSRGVPVPQGGKRDELIARVRLHKHKAATGYSAWTYDTWTTENLRKWLNTQNNKAAKKSSTSREELVKQAQEQFNQASKTGGSKYASVTSYLASATDAAKDSTFDTWSESELKNYLDSYGVPAYQGSSINELRALARRNANYFRYGTTTPQGTLWAKLANSAQGVLDYLKIGAASGRAEAEQKGGQAKEGAKKEADKLKEEL